MSSPLRAQLPRRIGAHRKAGLALYKALLTGCQKSGFDDLQTLQITNVIKNRYRENEHVASKNILSIVFRAGYQAVDHFDAIADGVQSSKDYLIDLLGRVPYRAKHLPKCDIDKIKRGKAIRAGPQPVEPPKPKLLLQDRPLPLDKLTGRRHIPRLVNAGGVPMLRVKKPQPHSLSGFIAARIDQRDARHRRRQELEEEIDLAALEDEWDKEVRSLVQDSVVSVAIDNDVSWQREPIDAYANLLALIKLELDKNTATATMMQDLIDKERAMARAENEERKKQRLANAASDNVVIHASHATQHHSIDSNADNQPVDRQGVVSPTDT